MSIRIHELAKKYNMEGRDMLSLLKERGYVAADTKSVSSTVSKIYVEEIEKEFAAKAPPVAVAVAVEPVAAAPAPGPDLSKARSPVGIFVKTAQDVARERESVAKVAAPVVRQAAPAVRVPAPSLPSRPVTAPRPLPP